MAFRFWVFGAAMVSLPKIAAAVTAAGTIGGGAIALNELHVPVIDFEKHLKHEESRYVLALKKEIREVRHLLESHDEQYLRDALQDLIDELCELRPEDRECKD